MTQTTSAQMVVPTVYADMLQADFLGKLVIGRLAVQDDSLVGVPGSTINFPTWNALTDIGAAIAEGTPITPEQMGTTNTSTATIAEYAKGVEITDKATLVGMGDPIAEARRQLATVIARRIDADLYTAALASLAAGFVIGNGTDPLSWDLIVDGMTAMGDDWAPEDMAGIVVGSIQHAQLLKDPNFISRDKMGDGATIPRGVVGSVGGMNVLRSDRIPTSGTPTYKAVMVKKGALGLLYKRRPIVETDRDILARSTVITTNTHYACKRLNDRGIVTIETVAGS